MNDEFWLARVKIAKKRGQKVGLVQGSWDLFHIGHLKYLMKARSLCDFLVVGMDGDAKIRKRKGITRPVIPEDERSEFIRLLDIADAVVIKGVDEPKWDLIKTIKPDVLIAIKENYSDEEIEQLYKFCGDVAILPRQAETSTSDKIRKITIGSHRPSDKVQKVVDENMMRWQKIMGDRFGLREHMLVDAMRQSSDEKCPVGAICYWNDNWYQGANEIDFSLSPEDIDGRSELFYDTVKHAEIELLKKMGEVRDMGNAPIYTTLFPCDDCIKVLADKKIKVIYYLDDHPERNWSKRAHKLAEEKGIETICLLG